MKIPLLTALLGLAVLLAGGPALGQAGAEQTTGPEADPKPAPLTGGFDIEDVLTQLEKTVADRDWKRYGDYLTEDFRFTPYDAVISAHPEVKWEKWDLLQEKSFIRQLTAPYNHAALKLRGQILDRGPESDGLAEWDLVYTLVYQDREFKSRAIFVFQEIDNLWFLREWIDTTIEYNPATHKAVQTSGSLRALLRLW